MRAEAFPYLTAYLHLDAIKLAIHESTESSFQFNLSSKQTRQIILKKKNNLNWQKLIEQRNVFKYRKLLTN